MVNFCILVHHLKLPLSLEARGLKFYIQPRVSANSEENLLISQLPDKNSKILSRTFLAIKLRSLYAKFQPSSLQTEGVLR